MNWNSGLNKLQKKIANEVSNADVELSMTWTLSDGRTGRFTQTFKRSTLEKLKNEDLHGTFNGNCRDMYEGEYEEFIGVFHFFLEVGIGFNGTIRCNW